MERNSDAGALAARLESAWNAHDMEAFGALFHEDATFVSRYGHFWRGRRQIVEAHAAIHSSMDREAATANEEVEAIDLADGAAVVHVRARLTFGPSTPEGPREVVVRLMYVATRAGGEWRIKAAHSVAVADPRTGLPTLGGAADEVVEKLDQLAERMETVEDRQEALIDEALEETFPSSDPISPKHIT